MSPAPRSLPILVLYLLTSVSCSRSPADPAADASVDVPVLPRATRPDDCASDPRVLFAGVPQQVCVGAGIFFRDGFSGNGRTCATCHPVAHNFTVDPAFIATLPATDSLLVAESNPQLAGLERPDLMRRFGLILENVDGFAPDPTVRFVMRAVPHIFALATSLTAPSSPTPDGTTLPPLDRLGWGGDGSPGAGQLRDFLAGAIRQHYTASLLRRTGVDFQLATDADLDAAGAFMASVGRTTDVDLDLVRMLDPVAELGRLAFVDPRLRCNGCHHNAGARTASGINRNFDTGVEAVRPVELDAQGVPHDGGFGLAARSDGSLGNGTFSTPPLVEAADTAPFFHTNGAATLEQAIAHYASPAFAASPAGGGQAVPLTADDVARIGAFLRVLNAQQNCQLARARLVGEIAIIDGDKNPNQSRDVQQMLAVLAAAEVSDALAVLAAVPGLGARSRDLLMGARDSLDCAGTHASHVHRRSCAVDAVAALSDASDRLASGVQLPMGPGSLMF